MKILCLISSMALTLMMIGAGTAAPARQSPGDQLYHERCSACHSVDPNGAPGPIAPNLRGVVGRSAATTSFAAYSPALRKSRIVWSKDVLDTFLSNPAKLVPGTRMPVSVPDPADRAVLIAYLTAQK